MTNTQFQRPQDNLDQELDLHQLTECSGGFHWRLLKEFFKAVKEGAEEIQETERTGQLPDRFFMPMTDVGGGSGVWSPPGGEQGGDGVNH